MIIFFFKQKTAYELRISDWSSDVCSSDLSERFDCVPFFWTEQYDFSLGSVGHAERWDEAEIDGSLAARDCTITYWRADQKLAVAVVHRALAGVRAEGELARELARTTQWLR